MSNFLREATGSLSSMRLAFLIFTIFFCSAIIISLITGRPLPSIPQEYLYLSGIFAGGKVLQKFGEAKPNGK